MTIIQEHQAYIMQIRLPFVAYNNALCPYGGDMSPSSYMRCLICLLNLCCCCFILHNGPHSHVCAYIPHIYVYFKNDEN